MESCLPTWKFVHNISGNQVGQIIIAWDDACCSVTTVEVVEQYLLCKVVTPILLEFYLSAVYGATVYGDRRTLWKNLVDNVASREGHLRKLDHVFCNLEWIQCLPQSYVHVQPPKVSDHCLLSIHLKDDIVSGPRPFKYHKFWEEHPDYAALIRGCWDGYAGDGSALDGLIGRLRKVKGGLKELNSKCFVDISGKVKQSAEELREVQERIYDGIVDSELMCKERNLREVFVRYNRAEMELLKSKARATYLEKGDFSTSFFHRSVVAYTQRHKISMIEDGDGGEHKDIIRKTVTARVPEEYWGQLDALPRLEEVKRAFHDMANGKSPGPDGFSSEFYKHNWNVVGGGVYEVVVHVFATGEFPAALNATTITLVPKSAFIPGRSLTDSVLLLQELVQGCHKDDGIPKMAIKVDLQKAYDMVEWESLWVVMETMAFPSRFIFLLQQCVQTAKFSVNVNGALKRWFGRTRGVRQGDPISSYLFLLVLEVFNCMMRAASQDASFSSHHLCQAQQITHMSFADDMVIVVSPTQQSIKIVQHCIEVFGEITGLKLNCAKSKVYFGSMSSLERERICRLLQMEEGSLPMKYLEIPLTSGHLACEDYRGLIDRICSKINSWQARQLSFGGRAQLVSVGNGDNVFFWYDPWCALGPVWDYLDESERASMQVPLGAKLSEVEWIMPGARRQTVRLVQNRLSTKDRLCRWGKEVDLHCVLCGGFETHDHLFFECSYAAEVWRVVLQRLAFVSVVAVLWEERNLRSFQGVSRESSRVVQRIISLVQCRASSWTRVKKTKANWLVCISWGIDPCIFHF
ncbi:hypothetical protein LIER_15683 [Lithospermum erythrorhizon]|uniref:Reverse transcriptase domain-containing protein n=1 Tax=Lithospermum erythrorhizon TaxID=34254 RepID=A0AAV3Q3T0_LITER